MYPTKLAHEIRRKRYGISPATEVTDFMTEALDLPSRSAQLVQNDTAPGTIAA
ncbi:MAG TPA: hypothetical protein VF443_03010 [Nitrospira sp.]